jgi:hypothetical protein
VADKLSSGSAISSADEKGGKSWVNYFLGIITFGLVMYFMSLMRNKGGSGGGGRGLFGNKMGGKKGARGALGGRAGSSPFGGGKGSGSSPFGGRFGGGGRSGGGKRR